MKKVLIFGVSGFVGCYLAQEFISSGYEVYGSDINKNDALQDDVKFFRADLLNSGEVAELVAKIAPDMIVNLAAISSVGASWNMPQVTMSVNVIGALNILEAAKSCIPVPKVMFIGSSEEYEASLDPIDEKTPLNANNPYGISKMAQERFAEIYRERYGMKIYCVRPFNHTGIGQKMSFVIPSFCKQVADIEKSGKSGVIKVGNLSAERDFSNVKDIVRAYRMIIESDDCTKIFNVGTGQAYSLSAILEYIISLSTQSITVEVDPDRVRPVDTPRICCDYSFIKSELGWEPKYSIFETVKEMFEYYVQHG
ncbi:MAG: GDP-6-deoxy-D-mannose reductase [Firmicutes bacterium ADurb.Bin419]|nr:MAG: GDP-6-deoxy-D-mannose reductase [Firmicutes bacterium ADurb.Bin419]